MISNFLISIAGVSGGLIIAILVYQLYLVRRGSVMSQFPLCLWNLIQRQIDRFYFQFGLFFKRVVHYAYYYSLVSLRFLVVISRFFLVKAEKKFSRLINSVRGKGIIERRGPASFFLNQIKNSREEI